MTAQKLAFYHLTLSPACDSFTSAAALDEQAGEFSGETGRGRVLWPGVALPEKRRSAGL